MKVVRTIAGLETAPETGLVPTMGALHDGHVAMLRAARQENRTVVMSFFVNPAQFDEQADLAAYPRDEARDLEIAETEGVDVVFAPAADELYPPGFATWVDPGETGAEGAARPGHFRGVATVVTRLFGLRNFGLIYSGRKRSYEGPQLSYYRKMAGLWMTGAILEAVGPAALTSDPGWGSPDGFLAGEPGRPLAGPDAEGLGGADQAQGQLVGQHSHRECATNGALGGRCLFQLANHGRSKL
jgi:hypothetical protein